MSSLKHPAVEAAERLSEGEDAQAILSRLSRAELIYVIAEIGGMEEFDADEAAEDIHGDTANANLTRDQIQAVAEFVAATVGDDE